MKRNGALVWAIIGFLSIPGLIAPIGFLSFGTFWSDSDDPLSALIGILWGTMVFAVGLRRMKRLLQTNSSWEVQQKLIWPLYRDLSLLFLANFLTGFIISLVRGYLIRDAGYVGLGENASYWEFLKWTVTPDHISRWIFQVLFIALTFPIIDRFFRFLEAWISAIDHLFSSHLETQAISVEPRKSESRSTPKTRTTTDELVVRYIGNIDSCNTRAYVSVVSMLVLLIIGILSFVVVFQGSPTSRALSLVSSLESSPALFAARFQQNVREADAALIKSIDSLNALSRKSFQDPKLHEEALAETLQSVEVTVRKIQEYFGKLVLDGSRGSDVSQTLRDLQEIKREIEASSDTNWDLIVVRTAIVLLSYFALRIFFRVFESSISERRSWEEKLSAAVLIQSTDFKVGEYLALTGKIEDKDLSDFMDGEIEKILQQLRDLRKP